MMLKPMVKMKQKSSYSMQMFTDSFLLHFTGIIVEKTLTQKCFLDVFLSAYAMRSTRQAYHPNQPIVR
jgi:hypothetical protein